MRFPPGIAMSFIALFVAVSVLHGQQAVATLGTCRLESGETLTDCRVAYRTFGQLNSRQDNAVLVPTWLMGKSSDWIPLLGETGIVDTSRYFVVVAEALGNSFSSSPSNTSLARGSKFPAITIRDMVETQYRLVTEQLHIAHLHAVVGISMGGMQAFEWGVAHSDFVDRLVSIVGTPRLAAYDRVRWAEDLSLIENGRRHGVPADTVFVQLARIFWLVGSTPTRVNETDPNRIEAMVASAARDVGATRHLEDYETQLRAMLAHDVSRTFEGDFGRTARAVRARVLVVYSPDDHIVTPDPSISFARQLNADTLSVPSKCGHGVFRCELRAIGAVVRTFLAR